MGVCAVYEKYSVLFVDDEVNILSSLKRGLMDEEFTCYFASSGKEALEILEETKISVIVSDMRMPEMDGLRLLNEVEKKYPRIIKMILSGYTQLPQILTTINQVDIFKFITKPWKLEEEFIVAIHKALDYFILQKENDEIKIALQNKNQAYVNILKNIEEIIASARGSSDVLGECGKQILSFNVNAFREQSKKDYIHLLNIQTQVFDLFTYAVKGEEKEISSEGLFNEAIIGIESYITISKTDIKKGFQQKVKIYSKIALAILMSCERTLEEHYQQNGLYIVAGVSQGNNIPTISLVCPKVLTNGVEADQNQMTLLGVKIDFLNAVISSAAKISKMDFCVTQLNGNVIAVLTLGQPPLPVQ